jgi:prepilin-type N-terminal cleavage/methylation domain-containing protein
MKLNNCRGQNGFTLSEMLVAVAIGGVALAATMAASVGLQKTLNAVDNYFTAHTQQIRIVDYLSRDVRRSYIVTSIGSPQTVTCTTPEYLDSTGARRTPKITLSANGVTVNYRGVSDGVLVSGSSTFTSPTAGFTSADVGKTLIANDIPAGTTIQSYAGSTTVVMSASATASSTSEAVTIGDTVLYSINGQSILRTENGVLTTIASSTDNLLPSSLDTELANTEYLQTSITFLPIFTSSGVTVERSGTTLYSTVYLRNKRRG